MRERRFFQKRSTLFGLTVVILAGGIYFLPVNFFRPLQTVLITITLPFENLFAWTAFEVREGMDFWRNLGTLKSDNERLNQTLLGLQADRALVVSLKQENEDLRREAVLPRSVERTVVTGEVIARHQSGSSVTSLRLNRGSEQGVAPGMPVVSGGSVLIGRIESVTPFTSEIRLLSHSDSLVAAMVEGVSGEALVRGDHGVGLLLDLARPNEKIASGAVVATAGLNDGLPSGLFIGTIDSTRLSGDQLFQQAILIPPVRADTLRFMSVITRF